MKKALGIVLIAALLGGSHARGQSVDLTELYFYEFMTFYLSSVDLYTGATDVLLFEYELRPTGKSARVKIEFRLEVKSDPLGLDDELMKVTTAPININGPIRIKNTDLNIDTDRLPYTGAPGGFADFEGKHKVEALPKSEMKRIEDIVRDTGRLPDGTYRIIVEIQDAETGAVEATREKTIVASNPVSLELIAPGGQLAELANTAVNTSYPFFQWQTDPCPFCTYKIRVAEFRAGEHTSMEDAIEDQTVLPIDQAQGYHDLGAGTSFQYPTTGALDLLPGHVYVWQIQKIIPVVAADQNEIITSPIYSFMIGGEDELQGPIIQFLKAVLGDDQVSAYFAPDGQLYRFEPTDVIYLNGQEINASDLNAIQGLLTQGQAALQSAEVQ